jgi:GDPmannose 4,6-dehydratase
LGKRAPICGVAGQDGAYLARLLDKGYAITGTSRDAQVASFAKLALRGRPPS